MGKVSKCLLLFFVFIILPGCDFLSDDSTGNKTDGIVINDDNDVDSEDPGGSQDSEDNTIEPEEFDLVDRPVQQEGEFSGRKFLISEPWNYDKEWNKDRKYPLVLFLHGSGERGDDNQLQKNSCSYLLTLENQQLYPSFVYIPQCPLDSQWYTKSVIQLTLNTLEHLISEYRIDRTRIYLIGYSMGGAGSYSFVDYYYNNYDNKLFAGIVRLTGEESFSDSVHEIVSKTALWIHVGLLDEQLRVDKTREAYDKLYAIHDESTEVIENYILEGYSTETRTLILNGIERVKKSEYAEAGHGIGFFPFSDGKVLEWLFSQDLNNF